MNDEIKDNITQQSTWIRGLYMLMFALFYSLSEFVLFAVVIFQFLLVLFTGETNPRLKIFGQSIAIYIYQIIQYLTFNSEDKSYPFAPWPEAEPESLKAQSSKSDDYAEELEQKNGD